MTQVKTAIGLWILLALVVFSVRFDWETRLAGHEFVNAQLARQRQGQPAITINDGFRPMVRAAAAKSAMWPAIIAAAGTAAVAMAARRGHTVS
jgi:hypothetical protein